METNSTIEIDSVDTESVEVKRPSTKIDEDLELALQLEAEINRQVAQTELKIGIKKEELNKVFDNEKKKQKQRCTNCNKKIGMINFDCKCKGMFCTKCRLPDQHNCNYDWKTESKEILMKNNPKIVSEKIRKL